METGSPCKAPRLVSYRVCEFGQGRGSRHQETQMEDADDIELAGWLFKCVLAILVTPAFAVAASFILN